MKKQTIAAVIAAAMLVPTAYAADWVYVSSWAYNDVSNFTNEGLLPDTFADVSDYRAPATLEQICELLYSVRESILPGLIMVDYLDYAHSEASKNVIEIIYDDKHLYEQKIYIEYPEYITEYEDKIQYVKETYGNGEVYYDSDKDSEYTYKLPTDESITRARAVTIFNSFYERWVPGATTEPFPNDVYYDGITDRRSTYFAKLNGIMDASYEPQSYMTIEQAIVAAYRIYNKCPDTLKSDAEFADENGFIQIYSNGIEEYAGDDKLILKQNGTILAEYETDVYKNIYCITLADGRSISAAQHVLGHTDIYSLADNAVLAQIPYATDKLTDKYIITKARNSSGFTYGLCDYNGNTLLPPEYSIREIKALEENGFVPITEQYRNADGWVYFLDVDTRYLYRVDTNGENEQLIADRECYEFQYIDGHIYALLRISDTDHTNGLYRMLPDGSEIIQLAENAMLMSEADWNDGMCTYPDYGSYLYYFSYENDSWHGMRVKTDTDGIEKEYLFEGDRYIIAMNEDYMYYHMPHKYGQATDNATYCMNLVSNTDVKVSDEYWENAEIMDGNIYFDIENEQSMSEYSSSLGSTEYHEIVRDDAENRNARLNGGVWKQDGEFYRTIARYTDEKYAVGYLANSSSKNYDCTQNRLDEWFYIDKATDEICKLNIEGITSIVKIHERNKNRLYITQADKPELLIYDMDAHKVIHTIDRVAGSDHYVNDEYYIKTSTGNLMTVNPTDLSLEQVYPCKGIYRYGKVAYIGVFSNCLCKIDENGFFIELSRRKPSHALLISN